MDTFVFLNKVEVKNVYFPGEKKNAKLAGLPFDHVATISEVVTEQPPSGYTSVLLQPPS